MNNKNNYRSLLWGILAVSVFSATARAENPPSAQPAESRVPIEAARQSALPDSDKTDRQLFQQAVELSAQQKWAEAESIYRDLMRRQADWPEPKNNLAVILLKTDRGDEARQILEQAVSSSENYRIAQQNRSRLYHYLAAQAYQRALGAEASVPRPELQLIESLASPPVSPAEQVRGVDDCARACPRPEASVAADTAPPTDNIPQAIRQQLTRWAQAWSEGNFEAYIQSYSEQFVPSDSHRSFSEWKNIRRGRLKYARGVRVEFDQLRVFIEPHTDYALVEFIQRYHSATYSDRVLKQLYMQKQQGRWLILAERIIKTY